MDIRQATDHDALSLKRLLSQLGYPQQTEAEILDGIALHTPEGYHLLVAEIDQEVIGFISLHWFGLLHTHNTLGRISAFCVDERFRGQGIGSRLMEFAENFLRTKGCKKIEVTSNQRRTETHQFYLKRGYKEDSRRFVKYE